MTYALGALGKGGGGHHGGGRHGGGHHGGHHGGGAFSRGAFGRGWGRGGGRGWYGPGYVEYSSYSPCDECRGQPPALYLNCMRYYGCAEPGLFGMGQTTETSRTPLWAWAIPVMFLGIILMSPRKSIIWGPSYYDGYGSIYHGGYAKPMFGHHIFGKPTMKKNKRTSRRKSR